MSTQDEAEKVQTLEKSAHASCRVETEGGAVYWISLPDSEVKRWVVREQLRNSQSNTMVVQPITMSKDSLDLNEKFKARLGGDLVVGLPFILELDDNESRILSEVVVSLEVGNVPERIFA